MITGWYCQIEDGFDFVLQAFCFWIYKGKTALNHMEKTNYLLKKAQKVFMNYQKSQENL